MVTITINVEGKDLLEIFRWCDDHCGRDEWSFSAQFPSWYYVFYLPDDQSASWFKLTWQ